MSTNTAESVFTSKQLHIIQTAIDLIGTGGIQNLTTKNISEQLGVTEPAIYRHFDGKSEILQGTLKYLRMRINDLFLSVCSTQESPETKLKILFSQQFAVFADRPELAVVLLSEGLYHNDKLLSDEAHLILINVKSHFTKIVAEGQKIGCWTKISSPRQFSFIIMGAMRLCIVEWYLSGHKTDLNKTGKEVTKTLLNLLKR